MNVLKITTTPIKLSMSSQKARLESHLPEPELGIIRTPVPSEYEIGKYQGQY